MVAGTVICLGLAVLFTLFGLIGLITPILPGLPLIFAAIWLIAYAGNYRFIGPIALCIFALLTLLAIIADYVLSAFFGARYAGASSRAIWGAIIGGILGLFFAPWGIVLGPPLGAMIGEFSAHYTLIQTGKVGLQTFIGLIIGTCVKLGIAFLMLAYVLVIHLYYALLS